MTSGISLELVLSSIALVIEPNELTQPVSITQEVLTPILRGPLNIGQTGDGRTIIGSVRDQIEVQFSPTKIDIRDLSGAFEQSVERIPRLVGEFLALLPQGQISSYGVNFVVEFKIENSEHWLSTKLLHPELANIMSSPVSTSLTVLKFDSPPNTLILRFEIRSGGVINLNFNSSTPAEAYPEHDVVARDMRDEYERLSTIVRSLEGD